MVGQEERRRAADSRSLKMPASPIVSTAHAKLKKPDQTRAKPTFHQDNSIVQICPSIAACPRATLGRLHCGRPDRIPFGAGLTQGPERVEDHRYIDSFLGQGALDRGQEARGRCQHAGER